MKQNKRGQLGCSASVLGDLRVHLHDRPHWMTSTRPLRGIAGAVTGGRIWTPQYHQIIQSLPAACGSPIQVLAEPNGA